VSSEFAALCVYVALTAQRMILKTRWCWTFAEFVRLKRRNLFRISTVLCFLHLTPYRPNMHENSGHAQV